MSDSFKETLKQFPFGHQGINHMKALVRNYVYWPDMDTLHISFKYQLVSNFPRKNKDVYVAGPINGPQYCSVVNVYSK